MKFKNLPMLMALSVGAMSAQAESRNEVELLVGSYTQGKSQGIYRLQFDSDKGRIAPEPLQVFKAANPSWLTLSRDQTRLFVVNENGKGQADVVGRASSVAIDPKTNALTLINQVKTLGEEPTHSSLSADERYLFVANYGVHADPAFVALPAGSGPRHLLFSGDGKHAYLTTEMSAQVFVFDYDNGRLKQRQALELAHGMPAQNRAAGALHASQDGKFLYVSNRGKANEILVFAINPGNGELTEIQRRSVDGDHPREFALSPNGKFLLIANQMSNAIVVLERDPETGTLGKTVQTLAMDAPSDLKFINRP